jgi:hypothetical protein
VFAGWFTTVIGVIATYAFTKLVYREKAWLCGAAFEKAKT